ncbi:AAA family ATPase [Trichlorobacter ammonificans]|uniref:AAA_13 domain-containing protein n=1 Tax=Trichlorobacter ammonificans TaxID=2916410 RepID=A0ABN8HIY6_9BACT|nr:AAA family ATPase [Trichlorobacter ammonificans]CAH2031283.1 AAA_13 domain-containing protein [Trichlorobacter ammonificans]
MIIKINRLANFANFRQFQWGNNTNFTKYNLVYGWNYSGKTTLSRLFHILANPTSLSQWQGCQFEVELQGGTRLTQTNLANPPRIKVFNRDFIQSNFQQEHKAPAVFIVGGNTIHLRNRISRLNEHETKTKTIKDRLNESHQQLRKELDSLGTAHASSVATLTGDKTYNRTKLAAEVERIKATPQAFILTEIALQAKVSLLRSTQDWKDINPVAIFVGNLEALCQNLSTVMQKTASNEAITKLKENRELESWIRTGLTFHTDSTECEFCGATISADRLATLQKHFSKAYEDLISEVATQVNTLEKIKFTITLPDERDFFPDLKEQFITIKGKTDAWLTWANSVIGELVSLAKQKQLALETQLGCEVDTSRVSEITQIVVDINALVTTHNQKRTQIDREKTAAKETIEKHHAAIFYQSNNILDKETAIQRLKDQVDKSQSLLTGIVGKKAAIEAQIQQQSIAAQRINETVQFLLPDNNISVAEITGGSFEFRRDGTPAKNLSEGEKTAITFAYFLATLENNGASLNQTIVFVDDPISSLDSNHIYAIYALITKRLDSCLQIFVSTHNSELYTLLKDYWFKARQHFANHTTACSYYTRRFLDSAGQEWHSTLEDTPNLLRKYKSEYQFIFEQLHKFSISQSPSLHEAYTAPNLLRKFLEAYLGFQKPCISKWSDKLDLLFDTDVERTEIQKFSDDASHLQGLNRALQQPNFVSNAQNTVMKVIQALKTKDLPHYTSMCTVIGVTP